MPRLSVGVGLLCTLLSLAGNTPWAANTQAALNPATSRARQLSPSNRGTPLIISEIMYHPREPGGTELLEFVEIFNTEPVSENLSEYRIAGAVEFTFPPDTSLAGRSFVVVARDPEALRQVSGMTNVTGPFAGNLPNDGGQVRLHNGAGALLLEVNYQDRMPWPIAADGAGHSLQFARPDYGERSVEAWSTSAAVGGSPGQADPEIVDPLDGVVINEFLAHTELPQLDFIELYNRGSQTVDLSGCRLSDRADAERFTIPEGTLLPPGGWVVFSQANLGFGLSREGDSIFLVRPDGARVIDAVRFDAQRLGVSSGRSPDGAPWNRELAEATPGASNSAAYLHDIVINEIMFHPISGRTEDEYIELHNRGSNSVDVSYWRFVDGIDFMIPPGTVIQPGGWLVVARDRARLLTRYPRLNAANAVGDFEGELSDRGERIALARPDNPQQPFQDYVLIDEVTYSDGWGQWTDGGGSSLELIDARADNALGMNWQGSDETGKAPWTDIEHTGVIDNQAGTMEELQVFCPQRGECLVDKIELIKAGETVNRVRNADFESGLSGWDLLGSHERSSVETTEGHASNRSLHVRATSQGRYTISVYRITYDRLSTAVTAPRAGETFTIRAKGRWIAGWPYIVIGVKGHALEAVGALELPENLGTPGEANSRRVSNAGPAISEVQHMPVLPAANQAVVVSAWVHDPDGVASVVVKWRNDTLNRPVTTTPMTDPDGDGVFSATLPGQAAGQIVCFAVEAADAANPSGSRRFPGPPPTGAPVRECLVRFGDNLAPGVFGVYRMWMSSTNVARLTRRETRSNEPEDATFTYDDYRTVYNAAVRYRGNWRTEGFSDYRDAAYVVEFPKTDRILGDTEVAIDYISLNSNNGTRQQEKHAYWMARQVGLASIAMRYVHVSVNGSALFRYDSLSPSRALCASWYGDEDPHIYEQLYPHEPFRNYSTTGGVKKQAKYRYSMRKKSTTAPDDDFSSLYHVVDALSAPSDELYVPRVSALADIRSWAGYWVVNRMCGNGDHYNSPGYPHNLYTYIPPYGRSRLHVNDTDGAFRTAYSLFPDSGYLPGIMFAKPEFRRVYWRLAFDMARGPMDPARSTTRLNDWYRVFRDHGISATSPSEMSAFITARRNEYLQRLAPVTNIAFRVIKAGSDTNANPMTIRGDAPIAVTTIEVDGQPHAIKWVSETSWEIRIALVRGNNVLTFRALDERGAEIGRDTSTLSYSGLAPTLAGKLVISEIMYHPTAPSSSFVEIHNRSTTEALPLGGLRVDGIDATIGHGRFIAPGGYAVLASSLPGYQSAYGNAEVVVGEFSGALDNGGERLRLELVQGTNRVVVDEVTYSDDSPWPTAADGGGASLQLIDSSRDNDRIGNWSVASQGSPGATPGSANNVAATLPEFPLLWINEVMPTNAGSQVDSTGESDPWIELFNAGPAEVSLDGCFLSNNPSDLRQWAFPNGWKIDAGQRLLVWADAQPTQTVGTELHAGFRLNAASGTVVLARQQLDRTTVLDALTYADLPAGSSYGSYPEGDTHLRQVFFSPTPAESNNAAWPTVLVRINEIMAANTVTVADRADGDFEDWFELHNAGPNAVDLAGYTLTDELENPTKFSVPARTIIPAGGFLLVWADEEENQNAPGGDLHVNFKLSQAGEQLALFAPDGLQVDTVSFGSQTNNVSAGRFPDGAELPLYAMVQPTPRGPNSLAGANRPPSFEPIADQRVAEGTLLTFTAKATDPDGDTVRYSLGPGAPETAELDERSGAFRWTPSEPDGPALVKFAIQAEDNGTPARAGTLWVTVQVDEVNLPPRLDPVADQSIDEGSLLALRFTAHDPDLPPIPLVFTLEPGAPDGASVTADGAFTWIPDESRGGTSVTFGVRVSDRGSPEYTDTATFRIDVRDVLNSPEIRPISAQAVAEGTPFRIQVEAVDPDTPPSPLVFSLVTGPAGATIDRVSGQLDWVPGEEVGPTNVLFVVSATEENPPYAASTQTFAVTVSEVNQPPTLLPIAGQTLREGQTLAIQAQALDADLPAQTLRFSLAPGAPPGLSIDPVSGWISWAVDPDYGASTNDVIVRVTDDGPPPLSHEQTFRVVTEPQQHIVINEIMSDPQTNGTEFVELVNNSAKTAVDLSNVQLTASELAFTFPPGTALAPGGFQLVVHNRAVFEDAYGRGLPIAGQWTGRLNPTGDTVRLTRSAPNGQTEVLDEIRYASAPPWPEAAAGQGGSLQLMDPRQDNSRVGNWDAAASLGSASRQLLSLTNLWRYQQSGSDLGTAWRESAYDDATWPSGRALLYVENAALPAPKNTPLSIGPMVFYFRTAFVYDGPAAGLRLKVNTIVDDAAVIYLNGTELMRIGFSDGSDITFDTPADRVVSDATLEGPVVIEGAALRHGTNTVAVEVHQNSSGSSDVVWGMDLSVESLAAPATPGHTNSLARLLPPFPPVFINEALPANNAGLLDNFGEREPWIELFNAGPLPASLDGWYLTDSFANLTKWAFPPALTLQSREFCLIWADGEPAESTQSDLHSSFRFPNGGVLALVRTQSGLPAVVDYLLVPALLPDTSFGSLPDGQDLDRAIFNQPTPGERNRDVPAPSIVNLQVGADAGVSFEWATIPGVRYHVEGAASLAELLWVTLAESTAVGDAMRFTEPIGASSRFYRVVIP
ncbi:MAG: lamin tail domain-containing protein [Verrucomicrobiia bacterium]